MIFVLVPKDACTTHPDRKIEKFLDLRFIRNAKVMLNSKCIAVNEQHLFAQI